ncbi:MAG: lysine--tRNA ligase [Clostridia bacterium]|nr:lysine--tRNA ligase [Clostridia bacterium]
MTENINNAAAPEGSEASVSDLIQIRRGKLAELRAEGRDPYAVTKFGVTAYAGIIKENFEEYENKTVSIAGRLMSRRDMGKANFIDISDSTGRIQSYVRVDDIGEDNFNDYRKWDIGDIIGLTGFVFRTRRGEISIHAQSLSLLSKSLLPLPEKYHGLTNTDLRYRQRYVDLIMNPEVRDTFVKRSRIISETRAYLESKNFLEVETPMLHNEAGGANARPFITHHNSLNIDLYLRIALELHLKRLIVGGFDRVYEIGRVFRNEGMDTRHNPEFTLLELYQAFTDYYGMMDLIEDLIRTVCRKVLGTTTVRTGGVEIDFGKPFERISMLDAVKKYTGVDFTGVDTVEQARALADGRGIHYEQRHGIGDILNLFFDEFVEEKLVQPTFLMNHPIEISPLAKKMPDDPKYTQRFELFVLGRELANAFSELNDPIDQRERFERQAALKAAGDDEATGVDEDFLCALEYGMPPTGGLGMGMDRFVMLLTGEENIRDVLLFPTMKPIGQPKKEDKAGELPSGPECACNTCPSQEACRAAQEAAQAVPSEEKIDFSNVEIEPLFADLVDFETFSKNDFRAVKVLECEAVPKSKKLLKFTLDDGTGTPRTILSGIHAFYEPEALIGKTCVAIVNLPPRAMMGIESCGMLLSAVHKEGEEEKLHLLQLDPHIPAGAKLY